MKKTLSLVLAVLMVFALCAIGTNAADAVAITPTATINGENVTMTATGLQDTFTDFDLGSLGITGATGHVYAMWFDNGGTFSFDKDVTLSKIYMDMFFRGENKGSSCCFTSCF